MNIRYVSPNTNKLCRLSWYLLWFKITRTILQGGNNYNSVEAVPRLGQLVKETPCIIFFFTLMLLLCNSSKYLYVDFSIYVSHQL